MKALPALALAEIYGNDDDYQAPDFRSGDLCSLHRSKYAAHGVTHGVTHYRCDDFPDGTVTDALTGKILHRPPASAPRGFKR